MMFRKKCDINRSIFQDTAVFLLTFSLQYNIIVCIIIQYAETLYFQIRKETDVIIFIGEMIMEKDYRIPLKFKAGKYSLSELTEDDEAIALHLGEYDIFSYYTPKDGKEVILYNIDEKTIESGLYAAYDDEGRLKYIQLTKNGEFKLVYIAFESNEEAKMTLFDFAEKSAEYISQQLLRVKEKVARIFVEYYYDGQAFEYRAKYGTLSDMKAVAGKDWDIDNCGDYPEQNRAECDVDTLKVMLLCTPVKIIGDMLELVIDTMTERIKANVIDRLDKTEDFRFIAVAYD